MAWHQPKTWKPNDVVRLTAAILNHELRDLLLYLYGALIAPGTGIDDWTDVGTGDPDITDGNYDNGWAGLSAVPGAYRKDGDWVSLHGLVQDGTSTPDKMFTLPAGYRPPVETRFPVVTNTGLGQLFIDNTGEVILVTGGNGYVDLTPVRFRVI